AGLESSVRASVGRAGRRGRSEVGSRSPQDLLADVPQRGHLLGGERVEEQGADGLEARGWVARRDCPEDGRGAYATLTDEGFEALREAAPGHVEAVRTLLFDPLAGEQVAALRRIGEQVLQAARPDLAPPPAPGTAD
ncbi:MAG: hypothetical protein R6T85_12725, partial [Egibacteraceae bacterium]